MNNLCFIGSDVPHQYEDTEKFLGNFFMAGAIQPSSITITSIVLLVLKLHR